MNRRILALILIGAMAISMLSSCKSNQDDATEGWVTDQGGLSGDNDSASNDSSSDQDSGSSNTPSGDNNQNQGSSGGQNNSNAGNQGGNDDEDDNSSENSSGNQNQNSSSSGSNQGSSSSSVTQTFNGDPISVAAGETLWYGPASTAQKEQLTFTDSAGKATKVNVEQLQKIDTFNNGYVIYAYKAESAGSITLQVPDTYKDLFIATKDAMDMNAYYSYWDNIKDRNLYVASLDKSSKEVGPDGKLIGAEESTATHAIPVKQGDTLTIAPVSPATLVQGCGYDAKMKPVYAFNAYEMKEAFVFPHGKRALTYTVPEGVSFVRINVPEEERENFLVTKNKEYNKDYYKRITKISPEQIENPLFKKECLFIGDSLCSAAQDVKINGQRGWARRVKELSGAICTNVGRGGSALSNSRMSDPDATEYHIIYKQLYRTEGQKFDYILLEGGGNDAWESTPIGKPTPGYDPDLFDLTTFAGGLEMTIYTAIKEYGDNAAIGYLMAYKMPRNTHGVLATKMGDYYAVAAEICKKWDITYFDMYNHNEIYNKLDPMSTEHVPDGTHADESGYDIIGPYINDYMKSMTPVTQRIRDELANIK